MPDSDFEDFQFTTDDGLRLHGRWYGNRDSPHPPVICLPGLSRNCRDFHRFASRLADDGHRVGALDYRGRGLSQWDDNKANYTIGREAMDVVNMLDGMQIDRAAFVGTSRGGLILHVLGAMAPDRLGPLVLNDIGPVIEVEGLRRIADYLAFRPELKSFEDAAEHLRTIHADSFPDLTETDWLDMAHALYRFVDGRLAADYDPALTAPLAAMDFTQPLPAMWTQFEMLRAQPMLIVRGENSAVLSEETVSAMLESHGNASAITAVGQGHTPILESDPVYTRVEVFLKDA